MVDDGRAIGPEELRSHLEPEARRYERAPMELAAYTSQAISAKRQADAIADFVEHFKIYLARVHNCGEYS